MDRGQFDTLARVISHKQSRRGAIAAVLGAALLGHDPAAMLAKGKRKANGNAKAKAKSCYPNTTCVPGRGRDASGCDFTGSNAFFQGNFRGSNLSHGNFTRADLRGADFRGANLAGACFVDVSLRDAKLGASVNLHQAIFCNAVMPDGSRNDSGCDKGTACCPTTCQGEACGPETCNGFGDFCGTVAGPCCAGWVCLNPPFSVCNTYCTSNDDCTTHSPDLVCVFNEPTVCGTDLPGDVGCCGCAGEDVGCVLRP
jgi:hypothetical protein